MMKFMVLCANSRVARQEPDALESSLLADLANLARPLNASRYSARHATRR